MRNAIVALVVVSALFGLGQWMSAEARPAYARSEGKDCGYCHLNPRGGGERGFRGIFYGANNLSFARFDEVVEAAIAGCAPQLMDFNTQPKKAYIGGISTSAWPQIQLQAIHRPVVVLFLDSAKDDAKSAAKFIADLGNELGTAAAVTTVFIGDPDAAAALGKSLGAPVRVLPDAKGSASKKYGAKQGLDFVLVYPSGEKWKLFEGFSKSNAEEMLAELRQLIQRELLFNTSQLPANAKRGEMLAIPKS